MVERFVHCRAIYYGTNMYNNVQLYTKMYEMMLKQCTTNFPSLQHTFGHTQKFLM